ncbi:hypothetical protein Btru_001212 [Bulinus truncatus]|nr:hypothetical protein Btru_001212 [Bulinus truncatus]
MANEVTYDLVAHAKKDNYVNSCLHFCSEGYVPLFKYLQAHRGWATSLRVSKAFIQLSPSTAAICDLFLSFHTGSIQKEIYLNGPMMSEKAEHVTGIVLQPLWKTQKLDWTVRKNVFETCSLNYTISLGDERGSKGRHPFLFRNDNRKETAYIIQKEQIERNKDRSNNPPRYRSPYNRRRWTSDVIRKQAPSHG